MGTIIDIIFQDLFLHQENLKNKSKEDMHKAIEFSIIYRLANMSNY